MSSSPTCQSPDFRNCTTADLPAACDGAHHDAERGGRLALAVAGVDEHDRARGAGAFGEVVLFGWFDRGHERLGRNFVREGILGAFRRATAPCGGDRTIGALLTGCAAGGYDADSLRRPPRRCRRVSGSRRLRGARRMVDDASATNGSVRTPMRRAADARSMRERVWRRATPRVDDARRSVTPRRQLAHRNSACTSSPSAASFSTPPDSRSITHTTGPSTAPRARSSTAASRIAPPEVTTSSTMHSRLPVELAALGEPAGAVGLRLLADEAGRQAAEPATSSSPAGRRRARGRRARRCPAGTSGTQAAAIARSSAGSDSNMYLSKYSWLTTPDRRVKVPVRCAAS